MIIASFTPYFLSFFQFQYVVLQLGNADGYRQPAVAALLYWPLPLKQRASLASVHGLISLLFFDPGQSPPRAAGTASFEDGRPFPLGKPSAYQSGDKPRYRSKSDRFGDWPPPIAVSQAPFPPAIPISASPAGFSAASPPRNGRQSPCLPDPTAFVWRGSHTPCRAQDFYAASPHVLVALQVHIVTRQDFLHAVCLSTEGTI